MLKPLYMSRIKSNKTLQCVEGKMQEVHLYKVLIQTPNEHSNIISSEESESCVCLNYA